MSPPTFDETRIGELLAAMPPAPRAWVEAAAQLPLARREIDSIVSLAQADASFRTAVLADLEGALRDRGITPRRDAVESLRSLLQ